MTKLFIDTNVLIDVMAVRRPFYTPAAELWASVEAKRRKACISATSVTTIAYSLRRYGQPAAFFVGLDILLRVFEVATVDHQIVSRAVAQRPRDFEDAVQMECAISAGATHIVTRDRTGFVNSPLIVISPNEAILLPLS